MKLTYYHKLYSVLTKANELLGSSLTDQDALHDLTCLTESCGDGDGDGGAAVAWSHHDRGGCELA